MGTFEKFHREFCVLQNNYSTNCFGIVSASATSMVLVNRLKHKSQAIQLQNAQFRLIVARMQSDSLKAAFRKPFFSLRVRYATNQPVKTNIYGCRLRADRTWTQAKLCNIKLRCPFVGILNYFTEVVRSSPSPNRGNNIP